MLRADVVLVLGVPGLCEVHGAESFSRVLQNSRVCYSVHRSLPLNRVQSQLDPVHISLRNAGTVVPRAHLMVPRRICQTLRVSYVAMISYIILSP